MFPWSLLALQKRGHFEFVARMLSVRHTPRELLAGRGVMVGWLRCTNGHSKNVGPAISRSLLWGRQLLPEPGTSRAAYTQVCKTNKTDMSGMLGLRAPYQRLQSTGTSSPGSANRDFFTAVVQPV